jgi:hypothetical protein
MSLAPASASQVVFKQHDLPVPQSWNPTAAHWRLATTMQTPPADEQAAAPAVSLSWPSESAEASNVQVGPQLHLPLWQ